MAPKLALAVIALCATALAGCTSGSDGEGDGTTSETGTGGVGGCVTAPGTTGCVNGTASGSASGSGTMSNTTTNTTGALENEDVEIDSSAYVPADVTIMVGGTVTWTHADGDTQHTVTADDGSFDSNPSCTAPVTPLSDCMTQGDTYTATFASPGEYGYHCKIHSGMTGMVRVVESQ